MCGKTRCLLVSSCTHSSVESEVKAHQDSSGGIDTKTPHAHTCTTIRARMSRKQTEKRAFQKRSREFGLTSWCRHGPIMASSLEDERAALAAERAAIAAERTALNVERSSVLTQRKHVLTNSSSEEAPSKEGQTVHILPGLTKTIKRQGRGPTPTAGQLVRIDYEVRMANGAQAGAGMLFNIIGQRQLEKREPSGRLALNQAFNLGDVPLKCPIMFDSTVATMQAGELCTVTSLPCYAFRERGMNDVPGDSHVELQIYLAEFEDDERQPLSNFTVFLILFCITSMCYYARQEWPSF